MYLIEWLEKKGIAYDVAIDEDLHLEGAAALDRYKVVLTGDHPEYWTTRMLNALETYLGGGGRMMYLGGNGFYWVTAIDPDRSHLIEVRRGINGTRSWTSHPARFTSASPANRAVSGGTGAARPTPSPASGSPPKAGAAPPVTAACRTVMTLPPPSSSWVSATTRSSATSVSS